MGRSSARSRKDHFLALPLLHIGQRRERARPGPVDLPDTWAQTLMAAGVDLQIREKHYDD